MSADDLLTIGGFTFSLIGSLIALISLNRGRKLTLVAGIVTAAALTTGLSVYRNQRHSTIVGRVGEEIIHVLSDRPLTFDEIHEHLLFRSFPLTKEALFMRIRHGEIRHRLIRREIDGHPTSFRVYFPVSDEGR